MKAQAEPTKTPGGGFRRDIKGLALAGFGVLGLLSLFSQSMGPVGRGIAWLLHWMAGSIAVFLPALALVWGCVVVVWTREDLPRARLAGAVLVIVTLAAAWHLRYPLGLEMEYGRRGMGGGIVGAMVAVVLVKLFGIVGRRFVLGLVGLVGFLLMGEWTFGGLVRLLIEGVKLFARGAANLWEELSDLLGVDRSGEAENSEPAVMEGGWAGAAHGPVAQGGPGAPGAPGAETAAPVPTTRLAAGGPALLWTFDGKPAAAGPAAPDDDEDEPTVSATSGPLGLAPGKPGESPVQSQRFTVIRGGAELLPTVDAARAIGAQGASPGRTTGTPETTGSTDATGGAGGAPGGAGSVAGTATGLKDPSKRYQQLSMPALLMYRLPSINLLKNGTSSKPARREQRDASDKAALLEETLASFDVEAKVVNISRGPAVTRFELEPGPGVKVAKITALEDDLALKLAAQYVRIEAPVPGKAVIGIEVPNREISPVTLRDVVETPEFKTGTSRLTVALGKDIAGRPLVGDLRKMTHLLIAGSTGTGKSVCINSIVCSILFKARPDEVKFLMIDPKVGEFTNYSEIPHLVAPVVTDPKKAASSLKWVVNEMTKRYEAFASAGVKDISRFNAWARERPGAAEPLPFIVVVIDELGDLMLVARADVEDAIQRLAQMARAAGIHLIVATQRPSVDVITGVIKANIPSRIAFKVASQVDSRTILDIAGAEKLLGRGDMLYWPVGEGKPTRAQGSYVSDEEVEALVDFARVQGEPSYASDVFAYEPTGGGETQSADDPLLRDAVKTIIETGQASTSMLQRRLRIGYTRAARLMDMMEERGIVGKPDGSRPRDILITLDQYSRLFGPGDQG